MQKAIFGGGCFWCTEAVFKSMKGVIKVLPGYAGGTVPHPTYEQVSTDTTGHAEVVYIEYDESLVSFETLLTVFFASHDPTTLNRQGADVGTQYRSVIFYTTEDQKNTALNMITKINASSEHGDLVVTEVVPFIEFFEAEDYHHEYFKNNPSNPYCMVVINPKLEKIQKQFVGLLHN
jgi:peptide-methionine (S)-S-oxide reductase